MRPRHARIAHWGRLLVLGELGCAALQSCGQGEDLTGLRVAVLRVTTATTGPAPSAYTLAIDGSGSSPIAPVDTVSRSGLAPGEHTVELGGVPGSCAVDSGAFRTVSASEGDTTALDFRVACAVANGTPLGALVITLTTVGVDQDPDGYLVGVDPSESRAIGLNESTRFEGLSAGPHGVRLSGLAANCSAQDENPRTVEIVADTAVAAAFAVRCWPPATGTIAFAHASIEGERTRIKLMDLNGTITDKFFTGLDFEDWPSWSPVGGFLAFIAGASEFGFGNTVFVWNPSTSSVLELPGCIRTGDRPQWSPDGTRLLCLSEDGFIGGALTSVRRDGADVRPLSPDGVEVASAGFLPDGSVIYTTGQFGSLGGVFRVGAAGGTPVRLFDLPSDIFAAENLIVLSPDGSRLTYTGPAMFDVGLFTARIDGTDAHLVSADLFIGDWSPPAWSPDGTRLAFLGSPLAGPYGVWLVAPDGSGLTRLPVPGLPDFGSAVAWSPDGSRLVVNVTSPESGVVSVSTIFVIRADGTGLQQLTGGKQYDAHPSWTP
jgi:Tol biopolymer transport system component